MQEENKPIPAKEDNLAVLQTKTVVKNLEVSGVDMKLVFDLASGKLTSFNYKVKSYLKKDLSPISGDLLPIMTTVTIWINYSGYGKRPENELL